MDQDKRPVAIPSSPIRYGFMTMTEKELLECIYSENRVDVLRALGNLSHDKHPTLYHLQAEIGKLAPGRFLTNLLCPLNRVKKRDYFRKLELINPLADGQTVYVPNKRYAPTGTFQTDGLQLRLLAYDTRVIKKFDATTVAPGRTVHGMGTDRWLHEIRNAFKVVPGDVEKTFGQSVNSIL